MGYIIHSFVLQKKINKQKSELQKKKYGWMKSRVGRLILSKGNFVSFVDMFSLFEVCTFLSEKPMFLIA